jgi:hypothetical protein
MRHVLRGFQGRIHVVKQRADYTTIGAACPLLQRVREFSFHGSGRMDEGRRTPRRCTDATEEIRAKPSGIGNFAQSEPPTVLLSKQRLEMAFA